jgi:hypothetical protein
MGSERIAHMAAVNDDLRPGHVAPRRRREQQQGRVEVRILAESVLWNPGAKPVTGFTAQEFRIQFGGHISSARKDSDGPCGVWRPSPSSGITSSAMKRRVRC